MWVGCYVNTKQKVQDIYVNLLSYQVRMFLSAPSLEEYKKEVKARFAARDGEKTTAARCDPHG